jgi:ABC-type lipoprotein release transport system permease subunit
MMAAMILRNVRRHLPRLRPMILALATAVAVLLLGNSISDAINTGYREVYTENITGDVTISAASERSFTVFGSEALLMGEFLVPPVLVAYDDLVRAVSRLSGVQGTAGLVTVAARVEVAGRAQSQPLFGVDFSEYAALFPRLRLERGSLPAAGTPAILIHESRFAELTRARGSEPALGSPVLLSVFNNSSFTIREVPLAGVFSYPVSDPLLDRVGLIDVQTARSLNGYVYGSGSREAAPDASVGSLDDLFAVPDELAPAAGSLDPREVESRLRSADASGVRAPETQEGAWNFLLIRLAPGVGDSGASRIARELGSSDLPGTTEIQVRDWRRSSGGNAMLIWIVQILLNAGLVFIAAGSSIVAVNALALSVLERTREIGTMRAIGASRRRVGFMISAETLVLVAGAGILGIAAGIILVALLNLLRIHLANPVLQALFGGVRLAGRLSGSLIANHFLLSLALGLLAVAYPLRKCLKIIPVRAMATA